VVQGSLVQALLAALEAVGVTAPATIELARPQHTTHGDWSSNVALVCAKPAGRNPRELAAELVQQVSADPPAHVERVEVAGPGFVNFFLADSWLHDVLAATVSAGTDDFGRHDFGDGRTVNIEFVSANPTGPVHAGHARGAAFGDAVARLMARCGYSVSREFYINDRGNQMELFAASMAARAAGEDPPEDGYRGDYVARWAGDMPADADVREWSRERALRDQTEALAAMGVSYDRWFSEMSLVDSGEMERTLADLRERGVVYASEGAVWLRSTDFGDDKDRVLVRSNGEVTYLLPDVAYHRDKLARSDLLIDVWGADHHGYVPRMRAAIEALGEDPARLEVLITQLVSLERDGVEVKIGKRSGELIELADVLDELGADATRFTYLLQSIDTRQTVDLALAASRSMDNPVYYVQYAHTRICSLGRELAERGMTRRPLAEADLAVLVHDRELELLRLLHSFDDVVALSCRERAPHKVTTWLRDLAGAFHGFYHDCPILRTDVDDDVRQARLWLAEATRVGLVSGLDLLGVSAPEVM
jgi:arginyl-tRNA synthetase